MLENAPDVMSIKREDCTRSVLFMISTSSHLNALASETRSPVYIISTRSFEAFPYIQRLFVPIV